MSSSISSFQNDVLWMTVVEKLVIIQKVRREQQKVLVQNEHKVFSGNRKQIVRAHACLIGLPNSVIRGDNLPWFERATPTIY